jgi:hypothetical protein
MLRNYAKLASLIEDGVVKYDNDNTCECGTPLLAPAHFNPVSRIDGKRICDACVSWEFTHGTKQTRSN